MLKGVGAGMGAHAAAYRHEAFLRDKGLVVVVAAIRTATAVFLWR